MKENLRERQARYERQSRRAAKSKPSASSAPVLVLWTGRLTDDGEALAAWLTAQGRPTPPAVGLIGGWAAWFLKTPDDAAQLYREYLLSKDKAAL